MPGLAVASLAWVSSSVKVSGGGGCVCWSLSHVRLFATPWTAAHQAPLSMGSSRQEYWSGLPFSGDLPNPQMSVLICEGEIITALAHGALMRKKVITKWVCHSSTHKRRHHWNNHRCFAVVVTMSFHVQFQEGRHQEEKLVMWVHKYRLSSHRF